MKICCFWEMVVEYLNKMAGIIGTENIKVLTGIRHSGKSKRWTVENIE